MTPTRYFVLLPIGVTAEPGLCPACDLIMDDSGCRLRHDWRVRPEAQQTTGLSRVMEVLCRGRVPAHPVVPCPACAKKQTEEVA